MARDDPRGETAPAQILQPQISLIGTVDEEMAQCMRDKLSDSEGGAGGGNGPLAIEMTTLGGDPEMARRMVLDIDAARERLKPCRLLFLGKTAVYSSGVTFMAAFPRGDRFLAHDASLLIHCRQLDKTIEIEGPMRASLAQVEALCQQMRFGLKLEEENFERLIEGSDVTMDELREKALYNWYLTAEEALERGLVAGIV
jgi:ATP-dependent protease ClpP protease subunit